MRRPRPCSSPHSSNYWQGSLPLAPSHFVTCDRIAGCGPDHSSSPAFAQQSAAVSTIRLTSAAEPASDSSSYDSNAQSNQSSVEQPQAAPPIQQSEQPAVQPTRSLAPPIVHTPVEAPADEPHEDAGRFLRQPRGSVGARPDAWARAGSIGVAALQTTRRGGKPFQAVQSQPTISPYLYLNAGTSSASPMTNYFAFVRPQLEQQESGRQQQREIQQLRTQLQKISSNGTGSQPSANTNSAAHYMDTAQFYQAACSGLVAGSAASRHPERA